MEEKKLRDINDPSVTDQERREFLVKYYNILMDVYGKDSDKGKSVSLVTFDKETGKPLIYKEVEGKVVCLEGVSVRYPDGTTAIVPVDIANQEDIDRYVNGE